MITAALITWVAAGTQFVCGQTVRYVQQARQQQDRPAPQTDLAGPEIGMEQDIDSLLGLKRISQLQTNIHYHPDRTPTDRFSNIPTSPYQTRELPAQVALWEAPNIFYNPLYIEDPGLERYGQSAGALQPSLSAIHFFSHVVTLPAQAIFERPFSCQTPLGYHRPGNCNPYLHYTLPW